VIRTTRRLAAFRSAFFGFDAMPASDSPARRSP
jgi:hypothetical protein